MAEETNHEIITVDDAITVLDTGVAFVTNAQYSQMCKDAEIAEDRASFMEEYGYVAVIPVRRNGIEGWACFQ